MKNGKWAIEDQGQGWRAELKAAKLAWAKRDLDEYHQAIENDVYMRALNGHSLTHIAQSYGVPYADFKPVYGDVWAIGNGRLQTHIAEKTIDNGLNTGQVVATIWLGKTLGGLSEKPASDVSVESGDVKINITLVDKDHMPEDDD